MKIKYQPRFYGLFHRFLHLRSVYPYIHKHHHRQVAPVRGNEDAINTHPLEYFVGSYQHLLAVFLVSLFTGVHVWTLAAFLLATGMLASLNHTRFDVRIPGSLYAVAEHDTHHKFPETNYGQYTTAWDRLLGSYREWAAPSRL